MRHETRAIAVAALLSSSFLIPHSSFASAKAAVRVADAVVAYKMPATCEEGTNWFRAAAADLTNVLVRVTGRTIPLYSEEDLPKTAKSVIRLGDYEAEGLHRMAFRINAETGRVWIRANTGSGASYGVSEFLERFADFYFVSLNGDDDPVVFNPNLTVPVCDFTKEPAIYCRDIYDKYLSADMKEYRRKRRWWPVAQPAHYTFARRTRCSAVCGEYEPSDRVSLATTRTCHTSFFWVDPEKHFKDHPEYFAYYKEDGQRHGKVSAGQICYSSKGALDVATESFFRFVAEDRRRFPKDYPAIYDFTQQDHAKFCECELCEKAYAEYDQVKGDHRSGGSTAMQLKFVNELARRIRAKYPDVIIRTFAYSQTEALPPNIDKPEPNVMFWYCDIFPFSDHLTPLGEGLLNGPRLELYERWAKFAPRLELWDYMLTGPYWGSGFPEVAADAIAADAKLFKRTGLRRIFCEHYDAQPFWELNQFLYGQLTCDPEKDVNELIGKYCRLYRRGAPKMREAIDFLRAETKAKKVISCGQWCSRAFPWRELKTFAKFRDLVQAAWDAEDDAAVRGHLAQILESTSRELMTLAKADPDGAAEYARSRADFLKYAEAKIPRWVEDPKVVAKAHEDVKKVVAKTDVSFKDLPPELKDAKGLLMFDYLSYDGKMKTVEDPLAESGRSYLQTKGIKPGKGVSFGVYDFATKTNAKRYGQPGSVRPTPATCDGKYHWHRVGNFHLGASSTFWFTARWYPNWGLGSLYRVCDGKTDEEDDNWVEIWVSVRFQGPSYVKGSAEPDGVWADRIAVRRIDPPQVRK